MVSFAPASLAKGALGAQIVLFGLNVLVMLNAPDFQTKMYFSKANLTPENMDKLRPLWTGFGWLLGGITAQLVAAFVGGVTWEWAAFYSAYSLYSWLELTVGVYLPSVGCGWDECSTWLFNSTSCEGERVV